MPGHNLWDHYKKLTWLQRVTLARKLGQAIRAILEPKFPCAGRLDPKTSKNVLQYELHAPNDDSTQPQADLLAKAQTSIEMLSMQFDRWRDRLPQIARMMPTEELKAMAIELSNETGVFENADYRLYHLDLQPQNILIEAGKDPAAVNITGILDWDSAIFAPLVVGCEVPLWLWRWDDCIEDIDVSQQALQNTVAQTPADANAKKMKEAFELAVGPEYLRFAYGRENYLARKLFELAYHGPYAHRRQAANDLLDDWEAIHGRPPRRLWFEGDSDASVAAPPAASKSDEIPVDNEASRGVLQSQVEEHQNTGKTRANSTSSTTSEGRDPSFVTCATAASISDPKLVVPESGPVSKGHEVTHGAG